MTDYKHIQSALSTRFVDRRAVDISIIVPVTGRVHFLNPLCYHLRAAINNCPELKISLTIVEHSIAEEHSPHLPDWVNYIFMPRQPACPELVEGSPFNKCLCFNIGAIFSNQATYYMFHDLDLMVKPDFLRNLFANLKGQKALQCFASRRVMYCDEPLSIKILTNQVFVSQINPETWGIKAGDPGAPGGSILVDRDTFFNAGGYNEAFTGYSVEDQYFWDCVSVITPIGSCNAPPIDIYHLWHENNHRLTKEEDFQLLRDLRNMDEALKPGFINQRAQHISQYKNMTTLTEKTHKAKLLIYDTAFAHGTALGSGDLKIYPDHFDWTREPGQATTEKDIAVITETYFDRLGFADARHRVGLIIEPISISPVPYALTLKKEIQNHFDFIFTHNKDQALTNPDKFVLYPFMGCWIYPHDRKIYPKTKEVSIVSSEKNFTEGHKMRHSVIKNWTWRFYDGVFGRGYKAIDYKLESLQDYRFQVVIENEKSECWHTEKLMDCFVTGTIPIYWGDPSIGERFNMEGILAFDREDDLDHILNLDLIAEYKKRLPAIEDNFERAKKWNCLPDNFIWDKIKDYYKLQVTS